MWKCKKKKLWTVFKIELNHYIADLISLFIFSEFNTDIYETMARNILILAL